MTNWDYLRAMIDLKTYNTLIDYARDHPIEYMRALVEGFDIEDEPITVTITPEQMENLRSYYSKESAEYKWRIEYTLELLDIKIPGVNIEQRGKIFVIEERKVAK